MVDVLSAGPAPGPRGCRLPRSAGRRVLLLVPLTILLCSLFGGIYGPRVLAATANEDDLRESIRRFAQVFHLVEDNRSEERRVGKECRL